MKLDAVLHIPMSEYCCGLDERHIVYRLRCAGGDLQRVTLFYADTACRVNPILFTSVPMEKVLSDACHDYWQVIVDSPYNRVYYYFQLDDGTETKLYYSNLFTDRLAQDRSEYFKLPFNHRSDIARVPAWVKDAVVYNIFPDSFASGKCEISGQPHSQRFGQQTVRGKLGGTLDGVARNVDYLKALGVNCVYLNPIFVAGEYHKYDLLDYYHVDPCFGGNEAFRTMVNTLHASGIRVIIDGVFNHCGWHFFAFEDVVKNQEKSRYRDWFYDLTFPVHRPETPEEIPDYACFAYERMMPKLNTANPKVQKYFCDVGAYWVREYGIDGWRLDVASEVNDGFWRAFRDAVKGENPEALLIGEVWESRSLASGGHVRLHHELRFPEALLRFFRRKAHRRGRILRAHYGYAHALPIADAPGAAESAGQPRRQPFPVAVRRGYRKLSPCHPVYDVLCGNAHHFLRRRAWRSGYAGGRIPRPHAVEGRRSGAAGLFPKGHRHAARLIPIAGRLISDVVRRGGQPRDPLPQVYRNGVRDSVH